MLSSLFFQKGGIYEFIRKTKETVHWLFINHTNVTFDWVCRIPGI